MSPETSKHHHLMNSARSATLSDCMFPWPVFKVSGPWGRARPQGTGQWAQGRDRHRHRRHRYPSAQGPVPRVQCPGGLIEGKLEPWKGNGSRSGRRRRRWDVGPSGRETQARPEATPTRGTCGWLGSLQSWHHHITAATDSRGSTVDTWVPGMSLGAPGATCPLSSSTGRRPGQTSLTRPPHGREGKRALAQLGLPISNLTATRFLETTPTANSICTSSSDLPARPCPAIRNINKLFRGAAQPLPLPRQTSSRFLP